MMVLLILLATVLDLLGQKVDPSTEFLFCVVFIDAFSLGYAFKMFVIYITDCDYGIQ